MRRLSADFREGLTEDDNFLCLWPACFVLCIAFSVDAAVCAQRVRESQWNEFFYLNPGDDEHIVLLAKIDRHINGRIVSLTNSDNNDGMIQTWSAFSCENNMNYYLIWAGLSYFTATA